MEKTQLTERLARQLVEATDLAGFLAANREKFAPETVASLKDEVDRLGDMDLTRAEPLARATAELARLLDDPVSLGYGDAAVARVHFLSGRVIDAERLYQAAIDRLRTAGRRAEAAVLERQLVAVLMKLGRIDDGLKVGRRARRVLARSRDRRMLAQLDTALGNLYYFAGERHRRALTYLDRARDVFEEIGDHRSLAIVEFNRGNIAADMDRPHDALALYERAEALFAENGQERLAAQAGYMRAFTLAVLGRYGEALKRYYVARERSIELGDGLNAAWACLYLAELHSRLNLLAEASELASLSAGNFEAMGYEVETARAHTLSGLVAERRKATTEAATALERAETLFARHHLPVVSADAKLARAEILLARDQAVEALELARDVAAVYGKARLSGRKAWAQLVVADALLVLGKTGEALKGVRAVVRVAERVGDRWLKCKGESLLGAIQIARGEKEKARESLERAVAGIEELRKQIRPGEIRAAFLGDKLSPYERLVELCLERGDAAGLRAAFRYVEMAKSRTLADLMGRLVDAKRGQDTADTELRRQLMRRIEELSWYSSRVERESEKGEQRNTRLDAHLRSEIARCERDLAGLFRRMEIEDADFAGLFASEPADLEDFAGQLAPDEAVVEFYTIGDRISAFVVTPDGTEVVRTLADRRTVDRHLAGLRFQLEKFALGRRYADAHKSALRRCTDNHLEALHRELLAPLYPAIEGRRLTFVPHGTLHYVPLHALKGPDGRYLLEHSEVSYCPSATIYQMCSRRPPSTTFGADLFAVGISDDRAPYIADEIAAVGRLFDRSVLVQGQQADKAAFFESAPRSRYLHIATHGDFRHDNPMFSSVRLADGPLSFYDVFDLHLDAELVTLSACNTGINELAPGDELCGLMRGFLYAGAPSLVVSLWAVNDRSTADIMRNFYAHLRAGLDKRAALRLAELEALQQYGHPYYWAPFVLMGKA
jgi:CHAT domain-containing protein